MAYADPQTVTVNAVAQTLNRVGFSPTSGAFRKDDGAFELTITQNSAKRNRQAVRLVSRKTAPDALNPSLNQAVSMSVTLVVDTPGSNSGGGYSLAEKKQIVDALTAYLTASSGARVTQLLAGEI